MSVTRLFKCDVESIEKKKLNSRITSRRRRREEVERKHVKGERGKIGVRKWVTSQMFINQLKHIIRQNIDLIVKGLALHIIEAQLNKLKVNGPINTRLMAA